jgi:hypothetical protein
MRMPSDGSQGHFGSPYRYDSPSATVVVLLLTLLGPALVVALVSGWRPSDGLPTPLFSWGSDPARTES